MSGFFVRKEEATSEIQGKVVLVGDAGVGKSCFMKKFVEDTFVPNHVVTIGVDYKEKTVEREKLSVKLHLWDTAGEERFRSLSSGVFKSADGCFLFYDITDHQTFKNMSAWKSQLEKYNSHLLFVLVGTKLDLAEKRMVPYDEAVKLAGSWGIPCYETSSKTGDHIDNAIISMTDKLSEKKGLGITKHTTAQGGRKRGITVIIRGFMKKG